jgi:HEAT repeat protein
MTERRTPELKALLSGGDRRSIARSDRALTLIRANLAQVSDIVALTKDPNWLVSMRAVDLLEKLAHENPDWVEPYKGIFLGALADSDKWEIRLQIVRALPRFMWSPAQRRRVIEILLRDVEHPQKFVRAWALDSLATYSQNDAALVPVVRRLLKSFERSGSKALTTRARHIRKRFSSIQQRKGE